MIWRALFDQAAELVERLIAALDRHSAELRDFRAELARQRERAGQ